MADDPNARDKREGEQHARRVALRFKRARMKARGFRAPRELTEERYHAMLAHLDARLEEIHYRERLSMQVAVRNAMKSAGIIESVVPRKAGVTFFRAVRRADDGAVRVTKIPDPAKSRRPLTISFYVHAENRSGIEFQAVLFLFRLQEFFDAMGYEPLKYRDIGEGSIWSRLGTKLKQSVTSREAKVLAEQARRTLEAMTLEKATAENAERVGNTMARLVEAGAQLDSVAIDLGIGHLAIYTDESGKRHARGKVFTSRELAEHRVDELLHQPEKLHELMDSLAKPEGPPEIANDDPELRRLGDTPSPQR